MEKLREWKSGRTHKIAKRGKKEDWNSDGAPWEMHAQNGVVGIVGTAHVRTKENKRKPHAALAISKVEEWNRLFRHPLGISTFCFHFTYSQTTIWRSPNSYASKLVVWISFHSRKPFLFTITDSSWLFHNGLQLTFSVSPMAIPPTGDVGVTFPIPVRHFPPFRYSESFNHLNFKNFNWKFD